MEKYKITRLGKDIVCIHRLQIRQGLDGLIRVHGTRSRVSNERYGRKCLGSSQAQEHKEWELTAFHKELPPSSHATRSRNLHTLTPHSKHREWRPRTATPQLEPGILKSILGRGESRAIFLRALHVLNNAHQSLDDWGLYTQNKSKAA